MISIEVENNKWWSASSLLLSAGGTRAACDLDLPAFWASVGRRTLHWYDARRDAWLGCGERGWSGWSSADASAVQLSHDDPLSAWEPWHTVCDESEAPFVRWFVGGRPLLPLAPPCGSHAETPLLSRSSQVRWRAHERRVQ